MKITLSLGCIIMAAYCTILHAQPCSVNITGPACLGGTLTANTAGGSLAKLIWYKNASYVYGADTVSSPASITEIIGSRPGGSGASQLAHFGSIILDDAGNLYVADFDNARIQKWAPGATAGITVAGGNGVGNAANQLNGPEDIAVDKTGNVYVCDERNNRVQKWAPGATTGVTVAGNGGKGAGADQLNDPQGIYLDKNGNLYIADAFNYRIQKWARNATQGNTVAGGNGQGTQSNKLYLPSDVYLDGAGNIYVADAWYYDPHRIIKWVPGADTGITIIGGDDLYFVRDIVVDSAGNIYGGVDHFGVIKWQAGTYKPVTVAGGSDDNPWDKLIYPYSVAVAKNGDVYVGDEGTEDNNGLPYNPKVLKYTPTNGVVNNKYSPAQNGFYTVTATFKNGCTAQSTGKFVGAPLKPNPGPASPGRYGNLCGGGIRDTFLVQDNAGATYKWKVPTGMVIVANRNDSIIVNVHADFTHGFVTVTGTNTCGTGPTDSLHVISGPLQPHAILGPKKVTAHQTNLAYHIKNLGFTYTWKVPAGASIVSGQGTASVVVNWGANSGNISVTAANDCGTSVKRKQVVTVKGSLIANDENVDEDASKISLQNNRSFIYPNPAVSSAAILFQSPVQAKYTVEVQDVTGKTVLQKEAIFVAGANKIDIDVSRYARGMYFVTVTNAAKQKTSFKLMKQ